MFFLPFHVSPEGIEVPSPTLVTLLPLPLAGTSVKGPPVSFSISDPPSPSSQGKSHSGGCWTDSRGRPSPPLLLSSPPGVYVRPFVSVAGWTLVGRESDSPTLFHISDQVRNPGALG